MIDASTFLFVTTTSRVDQKKTARWAGDIAERGHDVCVLSPAGTTSAELADADVRTFDIESLGEPDDETPPPEVVEDRFDVESLPLVCHTERAIFRLGHEEALERACRMVPAIDRLCAEESFDFGVQIRGPEIHRMLTHYVLESYGGTMIWMGFSPFEGECGLYTGLEAAWDTYRTIEYDEMTAEERAETAEHMDDFRDRQFVYAQAPRETDPGGIVSDVRDFVYRDRPGRRRDQVYGAAEMALRERINGMLLPSLGASERLCRDERYLFFPLQFPYETRLTVFSPQFFRQEFIIEYLSRILPSNCSLFVKQHPNHQGFPDPATFYRLSRSPNVQFLHPAMNAHDVIAASEGVIVTNNTPGFETLYHRKPLFTLGRAFYSETPAATPVHDLASLPRLLERHLGTTVPEENAIASVHSLAEASFEGDHETSHPDAVVTLCDSILEFAEWTTNRRDEGAAQGTR